MDNFYKSKALIITPLDNKHNLSDGSATIIGSINSSVIHAMCLNNYGKKIYGDDSVFFSFPDNISSSIPVYYLTKYGNIVFLNLSGDVDNKFGLIYLPENISKKQRRTLHLVLDNLENYSIEYSSILDLKGDVILGDVMMDNSDNNFENIKCYLNDILDKNKSLY